MALEEAVSSLRKQKFFALVESYGPILATCFLFSLGAFAAYKVLHGIPVSDVVSELKQTSFTSLMLAVLATLGGYTALIGYDWSALRFIGKGVPASTLALGSFTAYALGNSIGLAVLSGGAVRYRFYRGLGLTFSDIAIVSTYCALAFGVGVTVVGFAALAWYPAALAHFIPIDSSMIRLSAAIAFSAMVSLIFWSSVARHSIGFGRFRITMPPPRDSAVQILFSLLDIIFAASTLYILLPSNASALVPFPAFVAVFSAAAVAAVLSHVPGGIGVFEAVVLGAFSVMPDQTAGIAAALLMYRFVYYLLPLLAGVLILVVEEVRARVDAHVLPAIEMPGAFGAVRSLAAFIPALVGGLTFLAGATLVLNGIVPVSQSLLNELEPIVPVGVFEISNVVMGVAGGVLIVLANGLRARLRSALFMTIGILGIAVVSLTLQRLDFDLAIILSVLAGILWLARKRFGRHAPLSAGQPPLASFALWVAFTIAVVLFFMFAHQDAAYFHARWWEFAFDADMPRALRIAGVSISSSLILLLILALRPRARSLLAEQDVDLDLVRSIISQQDDPDANFALVGDKSYLISTNMDAFIMYGHHGRSFIALGPPVGNSASADELIETFVSGTEDRYCRPAVYQVSGDDLGRFVDAGFVPSKLGEEAVVNLGTFSLEGPERRKLRQPYNRAMRYGLTLEIASPPHSPELLSELKQISDQWLSEKNMREKRFSLGRFDEVYLQNFRIATARVGGNIVAFANVLETSTKETATIDLMRHASSAPPGTMDFLFIALMLTLKNEKFREFSLGMAPLTGLESSRHPKIWDRVARSISRFGGHFYNFEGLRAYKDKFEPEWRPKYLMTWGGIDPLLVMNDVNALVSGGLRGAILRDR